MSRVEAGCFGKLPFQGDFIRHGPQGPELARLDQWLQEGLAAAQRRLGDGLKSAFEAAPTSRFLLAPRPGAPGQRWLAGALTPGRDRVGRQFPFVVFAALDPALVKGRAPAALPALAGPLLDAADALARKAVGLGALPDLYAKVDACSTTLDPAAADRALGEALDERAAADLWRDAIGDAKAGLDALALTNLADLAAPKARPRFALALPVGASAARDVAFWLAAVAALRGADAPPSICAWNPPGPGGGLLRLVLGDLAADHAAGVFMPAHAGKGVCELARDGLDQPAFVAKAHERAKAALADPGRKLRALAADVGKLGAS